MVGTQKLSLRQRVEQGANTTPIPNTGDGDKADISVTCGRAYCYPGNSYATAPPDEIASDSPQIHDSPAGLSRRPRLDNKGNMGGTTFTGNKRGTPRKSAAYKPCRYEK